MAAVRIAMPILHGRVRPTVTANRRQIHALNTVRIPNSVYTSLEMSAPVVPWLRLRERPSGYEPDLYNIPNFDSRYRRFVSLRLTH